MTEKSEPVYWILSADLSENELSSLEDPLQENNGI